jgi:hypothetical protein
MNQAIEKWREKLDMRVLEDYLGRGLSHGVGMS